MSVDAYLKLARIGDGQCFVPPDFIKFTVHPEKPVAIVPVYGSGFLDQCSFSTDFDVFDAWCRNPGDRLLGYGIFSHPRAGGIIIIERAELEVYAARGDITDLGAISLQSHRKFWDSLTPGLWVVTAFHISGIEEDWAYSNYPLPSTCRVEETRDHYLWT